MNAAIFSLAAEPASILYIATGAIGFAIAGVRKMRQASRSSQPEPSAESSTAMLFCQRGPRATLKELNLL